MSDFVTPQFPFDPPDWVYREVQSHQRLGTRQGSCPSNREVLQLRITCSVY